ncbi:MAG: galactitol-1-phosphate 5-dehydrogenase [Acidobacteria bacterium]|nr:galactitol-1-phosphate 5-dehydrogenase [Acidobacteriota bacterium]
MKALVLTEYKKLDLQDVPRPEPKPNELLIRVRACGICGSDVHGFDGSTGRRIPPVIMGHEAAGVVVATGSAVQGFAEGDRVTFDSMISCGACAFCRRGDSNLCDSRQVLGVSCTEFKRDGAFAEYVVVPQHIAFRLPEAVSFEQAAMVEPVSVAVHAVNLTPITLGDTALVVGAGMIGLLIVQALRISGCARIFAIDLDDARLAMAKEMGADEVFNAKTCDAKAEILKRTGGRGVDIALEAVGATQPIATAIACLRKGGTLTLVGNVAPNIDLPLQAVVTRQLRLQGSCASCNDYPACIELMSRGAIKVDPLISARVPLDEAANWFERLYAHEPNLMKVIVQP